MKVIVPSCKRKPEIGNPGLALQPHSCIRQSNSDLRVLSSEDVVSFLRSPQDPKWLEELQKDRENNGLQLSVATLVNQFFSSL